MLRHRAPGNEHALFVSAKEGYRLRQSTQFQPFDSAQGREPVERLDRHVAPRQALCPELVERATLLAMTSRIHCLDHPSLAWSSSRKYSKERWSAFSHTLLRAVQRGQIRREQTDASEMRPRF